MLINTLCAAFQKLAVRRINITAAATRHYSIQQSNSDMNIISHLICNDYDTSCSTESVHSVKFIHGTLNIDFNTITNRILIKNIIEMPISKISPLQEPITHSHIQYDSPISQISHIDLPTNKKILEKQAVRLIIIRRKKMKKHKRKKLRKRMYFLWLKIRHKRNQKREKEFQAKLIAKIKEAEAFDAKEYVKNRLNILNKEKLPRTYRGEILPVEMIKQFLAEKAARKAYRRNKPRLTL